MLKTGIVYLFVQRLYTSAYIPWGLEELWSMWTIFYCVISLMAFNRFLL